MCPYPVFLAREVTELAGDDRLANEFGKLVLVIDVLVLLLYAQARNRTCPLKAGNGVP